MEFKQVMQNRRSVNFFDKEKSISDEQFKEIINLAILAPSAFNLQPWKIIAVKSEEAKEKLFKLASNQPKVVEAPITLVIVGDKESYRESSPTWKVLKEAYGEEGMQRAKSAAEFLYGSSEERKIKFAESNAGLFAMSIMLAAKEFGIDSHPMSGIDFDGIKEGFNLEDTDSVVMLISLGYFDDSKQLSERGFRKSFDEIVEIV